MNDHTKKVAKVGFAWLTIFSAVAFAFPLAYQIIPSSIKNSHPFDIAFGIVYAFWLGAIAATGFKAAMDADSRAWREYYDSLPPSGDGDDDDGDGDDDDVEWESDDAVNPGVATWKDQATGETRNSDAVPATTGESANSLATPDSGFVRADSINPSLNQPRIQVFRVPGGTLKPGM